MVTVKDVAEKAGVATSTVSRVINNNPSISDGTKKKVIKVMEELGYVPNIAARNLGKQISNAIGVVLPPLDSKERLGNPFFLEIIEVINDEALNHNMTTAVAMAKDFDKLLENVKRMHLQRQVDGFVLVYSYKDDPIIDYLYKNNVPFTLIGQPYKNEDDIVYIDNDNQLLGKQATDYLIEKGHENILFITNTTEENLYYERYFGYQKSLMLKEYEVYPSLNIKQTEDFNKLEKIMLQYKYTGAVVIDDLFGVQVMQYIEKFGYSIPKDFSIVSFNNSIYATLVHPHLTSIDVSVEGLGEMATKQLVNYIEKKKSSGIKVVVPHKLIERETVNNIFKE